MTAQVAELRVKVELLTAENQNISNPSSKKILNG